MRRASKDGAIERLALGGVAAFAGLVVVACCDNAKAEEGNGKLNVVTTLSVLADIAETVGGDRVTVHALSDPRQDPHFVQPRPTLMKKTREADVFIEVGLQLELWAEKVVEGSGNLKIQTGAPGRVVASAGISTLELPRVVSREWGDVHPQGNPHVWLDPLRAKRIAANIAAALKQLDPLNAEGYELRSDGFQAKINVALFGPGLVETIGGAKLSRLAEQGRLFEFLKERELDSELGGWFAKAAPLRGRPAVSYHKTWIYFATRFGLGIPVEIEERPGIPPSAKHRDRVIETMRADGVRAILIADFYDRAAADYVAEKADAVVVALPIEPGAVDGVDGYFALIDYLVDRTEAAMGGG